MGSQEVGSPGCSALGIGPVKNRSPEQLLGVYGGVV